METPIKSSQTPAKRIFKPILPMLFVTISCLVACGQVVSVVAGTVPNIIDQKVGEDDWSLPAWVTKNQNSGLYSEPSTNFDPEVYTVTMTWKEINPKEGVFDWRRLEGNLQAASKINKRIWLRIYASDVKHVPTWVKAKYPDLREMQYPHEGGVYFDVYDYTVSAGKFYPIWHAGFDGELKKMLASFKTKDFLANPALAFIYAPGAWRWNEWAMFFVGDAKRDGLTPALFLQWFQRELDAYADAAGNNRHKLLFTGEPHMDRSENNSDWVLALNDLPNGRNRMVDYAVGLGMSVRIGAQEYFNPFSNIPSWGAGVQTIDAFNYQRIDENHPLHSDRRRIIGSETEMTGNNRDFPGTDKYYLTLRRINIGSSRLKFIN
jgi:hypothetical protein